jgi:hypothetical protein
LFYRVSVSILPSIHISHSKIAVYDFSVSFDQDALLRHLVDEMGGSWAKIAPAMKERTGSDIEATRQTMLGDIEGHSSRACALE